MFRNFFTVALLVLILTIVVGIKFIGNRVEERQEQLVYLPNYYRSSETFVGYKWITHQGTRMQIPEEGITDRVLVLYHGNAGAVIHREYFRRAAASAGYTLLAVEYAGYGSDTTPPTHARTLRDVVNTIDFLRTQGVYEYAIVGESIGSGFASYHTSLEAPAKLVLVSPFTSLVDAAKDIAGWKGRLIGIESRILNVFDNVALLHEYRGDVLVIHGAQDATIPYLHGIRLHATLSANKTFVTIPSAGHNNLFSSAEETEAERKLVQFLTH